MAQELKSEKISADNGGDAKKQYQSKTAVSYIRIACAGQNCDERLLRYQAFVREEARILGAKIVAEFQDIGVPAKIENQLELKKLMQYVKNNPIDFVIAPNFAMLSGDTSVVVDLKNQIEQTGAKLLTPSGEEEMIGLYCSTNAGAEVLSHDDSEKCGNWPICHRSMTPEHGCTMFTVYCNGQSYERLKVGEETNPSPNISKKFCEICNAGHGQYHHWNCDAEECPFCHGSLVGCDCDAEVLMKR